MLPAFSFHQHAMRRASPTRLNLVSLPRMKVDPMISSFPGFWGLMGQILLTSRRQEIAGFMQIGKGATE